MKKLLDERDMKNVDEAFKPPLAPKPSSTNTNETNKSE